MNKNRKLTTGQVTVLILAAVPIFAAGALGAWGTYENINAVFHRDATAWGVVAAGEGATLSLSLVLVGLTLLGQSSPAPVRAGMWALPAIASVTGAVVANDFKDAVVYAVTPMAMCVSAEGAALLARRVVVYQTDTDAEAQRRNAETMQKLAYHRARAANHPDEKERAKSDLESWKIAEKIGVGDLELGSQLVHVQREGLGRGADSALRDMLSLGQAPVVPELSPSPPDGDKPGGQRVPEGETSPRDTTVIAGQVLSPAPKILQIGPALSLSAYVKEMTASGYDRDTIRDKVKSGEYTGHWTEAGLTKALKRYAPRSA